MISTLGQDLRFAARMLTKRPGFTLVAVLTLALSIGANTALFSVVQAVLLRPLPFHDPERLVDVWQTSPKHDVLQGQVSYPDFLDWKNQNRVFEGMAAYHETHGTTLSDAGDPLRLHGAIVSPGFFELLGVKPTLGGTFTSDVDIPGKSNVVILSAQLWQSKFQSDPRVLGRSVTIAGKPYTVLGVMPRDFQFPILAEPIDVWVPLAAYDGTMPSERGAGIYFAIARLKPGVSLAQASSQLNTMESRLAAQYPETHSLGDGANVALMLPDLVSGSRKSLLILFGAVAVVLLIACANVANLMLVRASDRAREFAIRRALGARRSRLIRQLLTESALLAIVAGGCGLLLGYWAMAALVSAGPRDIPRLATAQLDARVFAFTLGVSLLTGVIFGLVPALRNSQADLGDSLKERMPHGTAQSGRGLRDSMIVAEVALSLILITAACLLLRTLWHLENVNPGFDPAQVLTFATDLPNGYTDAQTTAFYQELLPKLRALPGAEHVSAVFPLPFSGVGITTDFEIEGRPSDPSSPVSASLAAAERDYFQTMHIALRRGRAFREGDGVQGKGVAIVNQSFAKQYFPNEDALGKQIKPGARTTGTPAQMCEIIGVVNDTKTADLREESRPIVFVPVAQLPIGALSVVIRTGQSPAALMSAVRERVQAVEPAALVFRGKTLEQYLTVTLGQPRFNALLLCVFAAVAMLLAIVGLYGAVAYAVSQRTHEIGVRMALGARPADVLAMVLSHGARLILVGIIGGLAAALALTRFMASLLFGVRPADPWTFALMAATLGGLALAACCIPAQRAARVDPMVALRYE